MTIFTHVWDRTNESENDTIVTIDTNTCIVELSNGERFNRPFTHGYGGIPEYYRSDVFASFNFNDIREVFRRTYGGKTFLGIITCRNDFFGFEKMPY